ncbi:MAG: hypothetical protein ACP5D5_08880 [Acidithiobacillus sp.]|uniref:hypothetical protein n=1 Tax=Acidithiobacillus sp. TaxID=1872118 RepID=UPI003D025D35
MSLPTVPAAAADISNASLSVPQQEALASLLTDITNLQATVADLVTWSKNSSYAASTIAAPAAVQTTASGAIAVTGPTDTLQNGTVVSNQA